MLSKSQCQYARFPAGRYISKELGCLSILIQARPGGRNFNDHRASPRWYHRMSVFLVWPHVSVRFTTLILS